MIPRPATGRRIVNLLVSVAASVAASAGIFILLWITLILVYKGFPALNLGFFINLPTPPMVPGGGFGQRDFRHPAPDVAGHPDGCAHWAVGRGLPG